MVSQTLSRGSTTKCLDGADVSPKNDGRLKLEYDDGFGGPLRKERTYEAVKVL